MVFDDDTDIRLALAQIDAMITNTGDHLLSVLDIRDPELPSCVGLVFGFPERQITIAVRSEDDSVSISVKPATQETQAGTLHDTSSAVPWCQAVGKSLASFCILLNNRGTCLAAP
jgi:hypothetical protein